MVEKYESFISDEKAINLDQIPWWRRIMPDLTPVKCIYVNGQPRRYYKNNKNGQYYYRRIAESEMYKSY